jgi:PAS domain S-box-containing protein
VRSTDDRGPRHETLAPPEFAPTTAQRLRDAFGSPEEREDFLRTIGNHLPEAFFYRVVHEPDGTNRFTYVSSGVEVVCGVSAAELLADSDAVTSLIVDADQPAFWRAVQKAVSECSRLDHVVRLRRRDGALRWCHFRSAVRLTEDGTKACEGILLDVTSHKRAEEALVESETRQRAILAALPDMMFVLDHDGRYLDVHYRRRADLLVPPEQFLGRRMDEVLPPELASRFRQSFGEALSTGGTAVLEYVAPLEGGAHSFEARIVPCGHDKILAIIRDITENRQAQHEAQANRAELARVGRTTMLGEIAASLAHELNQPLAAILNNAQAGSRLLETGAEQTELPEILNDIAGDAQRAGHVIAHLRSMLVPTGGLRQSLCLNRVVSDVEPLVRGELATRRVRLHMNLGEGLPAIEGDVVQLQQVVLNLLLNAIDAMDGCRPADRDVTIRTARMNGHVEVHVTDSGTGIAPEHMARLFDPFFTSKKNGLGMGLRICSSIIGAHGGRIWAENNAVRGATFVFALPIGATS